MVRVPLEYAPSQSSFPEYVPLTESAVMSEIVPVRVARHWGVGSLAASAGKEAVQLNVVPVIVPERVPVRLR
jgi:hypothetical protein